jgi:membrane-bound lytic murein transglycosylase D
MRLFLLSFLTACGFLLSGCASQKTKTSKKNKSHLKSNPSLPDGTDFHSESETLVEEDSESIEDDEDSDLAETNENLEGSNAIDDSQIGNIVSEEERKADAEARRTFPLVYNEMVEMWIRYFTSKRGYPVMHKWLTRSTRYIPMMKQVLRDQGLPEDLIYLSMIESGFNPIAKSRAKAVGPWQFIKGTGTRYGLKVDYWTDERRDYRKSTFAAAQYLKELHQIFGSWYLAAAGYNAGEGKVLFAVRRDRSRNFWELARKKKNFRAETRNYVPKIIAAALISKNPEKYGFTDIPFEEPLAWTEVRVPSGVDLKTVSRLIEEDEFMVSLLNSELRRGITPPGKDGYLLRVPPQKKDILLASLDKLESKKIGNFLEHTLRPGESLGSLSRKYGVSVSALQDLNQISNPKRLRPGQEILIPVGGDLDSDRPRRRQQKMASQPPTVALNGNIHTVQEGDSLWSISKKYNVSLAEILKANGIGSRKTLKIGSTLSIPSNTESKSNSGVTTGASH